uniref:TlpA family protein disulfide reductase n=1 Tax=Mesorhizobium atlanticum TaxID=2233532 RepID=UPI00370447D0
MRRFSTLGISLTAALVLAIAIAVALSFQLVGLLTAPLDDGSVVASTANGGATAKNLQVLFLDRPAELPDLAFVDGDERPVSLADFRGRPVLLNIWATCSVPCRNEMPSLDRLQAKFEPSQFLVLALSIDRGIPAVKNFYQELEAQIAWYLCRSIRRLFAFAPGASGVPTTLFIDREGREIGRKIGAAEWDSSASIALLREHMNLPSGEQAGGAPK